MEQFSMPCQFWEVRKVALTVRATEREGHVLHRAERQKTLEVQEGQPGGSSILSAEGQGLERGDSSQKEGPSKFCFLATRAGHKEVPQPSMPKDLLSIRSGGTFRKLHYAQSSRKVPLGLKSSPEPERNKETKIWSLDSRQT